MNKEFIIILIFALAHTNVNAQFFFRISGNKLKQPSYILGSLHTLPGSILDTIPEYLEAEAKCKQLVAEYDISDQQKMKEVQTAGKQAAGKQAEGKQAAGEQAAGEQAAGYSHTAGYASGWTGDPVYSGSQK